MRRRQILGAGAALLLGGRAGAEQAEPTVPVERVEWLPETRSLEMFSALAEGPDGLIYAGTCNAAKIGANLISFDLKTRTQQNLLDMQVVCRETRAKTFPQSKIHSQICFDSKGTAWFGTHSYEWVEYEQFSETPEKYTGGHLATYHPQTRTAADLGIPKPHQSIMSLALAEKVGKVYLILHPTGRVMIHDIATGRAADRGQFLGYPTRAIVALSDGRGFTFDYRGRVVRYLPEKDELRMLPVSIPTPDGAPDAEQNCPFDLVVSSDEKRIYGIGWISGLLFEYRPDDGEMGSIRSLGPAFGDEKVPGVRSSLCIAMTEGRDGKIYYAGYYENRGRLACYDPKTDTRRYLGRMTHQGRPIGTGPDAAGTAGAMCTARDGTIVVADFDNRQTYFNWFHPDRLS